LGYAEYKAAKAEATAFAVTGGSVVEELDRSDGTPVWHAIVAVSLQRGDERFRRLTELATGPGCFATVHGHSRHVLLMVHLRGEITERETQLPA